VGGSGKNKKYCSSVVHREQNRKLELRYKNLKWENKNKERGGRDKKLIRKYEGGGWIGNNAISILKKRRTKKTTLEDFIN
jgi:hypothetical protein